MIGELIRCEGAEFDPKIAAVAVQWCRTHSEELILPETMAASNSSPVCRKFFLMEAVRRADCGTFGHGIAFEQGRSHPDAD